MTPAATPKEARKCRVCGCTDNAACYDPGRGFCRWATPQMDVCSHCQTREHPVGHRGTPVTPEIIRRATSKKGRKA